MHTYHIKKKSDLFKEFSVYTYLWNSVNILKDVQNQYSIKNRQFKRERFSQSSCYIFP